MPKRDTVLPHASPSQPRYRIPEQKVGLVLAAMRNNAGYQCIVETDRHGETSAWLLRAALRMV